MPRGDVAWLEKLLGACNDALARVDRLDDPFSRDLTHDLEAYCARVTRLLDEART